MTTSLPSPDFSGVTVKWAGNYMDGSPVTGRLLLTYDGGIMLDDDAAMPVNIFPKQIALTLTTSTIVVGAETKTVGYAEATIPASNDPDIDGAGGTYTFTEEFTGGRKNISFVADKDTPGGVIWLNKITGTEPVAGEPLSVVYYSDFTDLKTRVDALEAAGGGVSSYLDLTDVPTTFPPSAHTHAQSEVTGLGTALSGKASTVHSHVAADVSDLDGLLDLKADATHGHAASDTVSGVFADARMPAFDITVDYVKSGAQHGTANAWPSTRPGLAAGCVNWKGPVSAGSPGPMIDGDDREYVS